jgi:hypothetical protein
VLPYKTPKPVPKASPRPAATEPVIR